MLNSRKLVRALALAGLFALGGVSSYAQICSGLLTTTNLGVRPEGLTELTGDIVVNCTATSTTPGGGAILPTDFTVLVQLTTGVAITNSTTTVNPTMTFTPGTGTLVNVAYPGGLVNAISFQASGVTSSAFTIGGIRINANAASAAGISSVLATLIITTVSTGGTTVLPLANNPSLVATILPKSLNFSIIGGSSANATTGSAVFPICVSNTGVSGFFRFTENFSNVLRNQAQEGPGATNGTYVRIIVSNIPSGITLLVPNGVLTTGNNVLRPISGISGTSATGISTGYTPNTGAGSTPGGDPSYSGGYGAASSEFIYWVESVGASGGGTSNSTATVDSLSIPFIARYTGSPSIGLGTATARGGLGPVGTTTAIPRFADITDQANSFGTTSCSTTLLYPYVTTAAGFDTGIAIANTTADPSPLATPNQSGTCTINAFGTYGSGATVPGAGTTPTINAGTVWAASLTDSPIFAGGSAMGAGFTGYLIAGCSYQLAHGFAFVSTYGLSGANSVAQGYLALVLQQNTGSRTMGANIEALNN